MVQQLSKVKAIVLDVDLTICDSNERKKKAFERAFGSELAKRLNSSIANEYGFERLKEISELKKFKNPVNEVVKHFLYDKDLFELDKPLGNAVKVVNEIASLGYKIYYVSGRPLKETVNEFIERFKFPKGKVYCIEVKPGESMKKVTLFKEIMKEVNAKKGEVVSVADQPGDALAAKSAGMVAVALSHAHPYLKRRLDKVADFVIERIDDLINVIRKIEKKK
jgi:phosphoglycolate phosphatase-like HAD superfamily hydrolase